MDTSVEKERFRIAEIGRISVDSEYSTKRILASGLEQLGIEPTASRCDSLLSFAQLVLDANKRTNLVGAKDLRSVVVAHILDSLAAFGQHTIRSPIVDVGSSAGFPAVPLAIVYPNADFILLEPRAKRAEFLQGAVADLKLPNVEVLKLAAETAGRGSRREAAKTALARALGPTAVAFELTLPLVRVGGSAVFYRGKQAEPTQAEVAVAARLGGTLEQARRVTVPYLDAQRHIWIFTKTAPTPRDLPRRSGLPKSQPLSS
jgi:16S rRNA (guanine527-N7)-methyltransferase